MLLDEHGVFKQYRKYDKDHYLVFEIGWHHEPSIDKKADKVLHVHEYTRDFQRTTRPITPEEYEKYKRFFKLHWALLGRTSDEFRDHQAD